MKKVSAKYHRSYHVSAAECVCYDGEHYSLPVIGLWTFGFSRRHSFRWPSPWLFTESPGDGSIPQLFRLKLLHRIMELPWNEREPRALFRGKMANVLNCTPYAGRVRCSMTANGPTWGRREESRVVLRLVERTFP